MMFFVPDNQIKDKMHIIYKYAFVVSLDFFKSMINIDAYIIVKYGINLWKTFVKKKIGKLSVNFEYQFSTHYA